MYIIIEEVMKHLIVINLIGYKHNVFNQVIYILMMLLLIVIIMKDLIIMVLYIMNVDNVNLNLNQVLLYQLKDVIHKIQIIIHLLNYVNQVILVMNI